jgi:uncharacterized protein YjdB
LVYKGKTLQLKSDVMPETADDKGLTWTSSNTKIATVDAQGLVTGKSAGKVKITALAKDGSSVADTINLTVVAPETSIKLSKSSAILYHNGETDALKTLKLTVTTSPKGSAYRMLSWSVESGNAATVDENGVVTAVQEGITKIRATTDNGHNAECDITVRTLPSSLRFKTIEKTLAFKQGFDLGAEVEMDGTEPALTWRSNNTKVATVSGSGVVKAGKYKAGTAIITATSKNDMKAVCTIKVVKSLSKSTSNAVAEKPAHPIVSLRLLGDGYATSDDRISDVGKNGDVVLKTDGVVTFEAGGDRIICKVKNENPVELTLYEGSGLILVTDAAIQWTVEDDRIASIDSEGNLTALREGKTMVTGTIESGWTLEIHMIVCAAGDVLAPPEPEPNLEATAEPEPTVVPEPAAVEEPTPPHEAAPSEPELEPDAPSDTQTDTSASG